MRRSGDVCPASGSAGGRFLWDRGAMSIRHLGCLAYTPPPTQLTMEALLQSEQCEKEHRAGLPYFNRHRCVASDFLK
jgi:hypothetical protein